MYRYQHLWILLMVKDTVLPMKGAKGKFFTLGISALDCTGCGSCADVCPARKKAISMQDAEDAYVNKQQERYNYLFNEVTEKEVPFKEDTIKGSYGILRSLSWMRRVPLCKTYNAAFRR